MLAPVRKSDRVLIVFLAAADLLAIPMAFLLTWWLRTGALAGPLPAFHHVFADYLLALPVVAVLWMVCWGRNGLYRPMRSTTGMERIQRLMKAAFALAVSMMAASYLVKRDYSRLMLFMFVFTSVPISLLLRAPARWLAERLAPIRSVPRILVVGSGEVAARVLKTLQQLPAPPPELVGVLTDDPEIQGETFHGLEVLGRVSELRRLAVSLKVDEVFFASPNLDRSRVLDLISSVKGRDIHYRMVTDLFEIATGTTSLDDMARLPIVEIGYGKPGFMYRFLKRTIDVVVSLLLLVVLAPLFALVWVLLRITAEGSPIFRQRRVGLAGKEFTLLKFRTMVPDADEYEVAPMEKDDPRVTVVGGLLRRTSLDELPQLVNVFRGEMSLVGPRPEMPFIVDNYNRWQLRRLDVRPGITGLWQIMGRKDLPLHENIEYDFYYIRNQSLMLDFAILLRTVLIILKGRGAY